MFHQWQKFNVGEAHVANILNEFIRHFRIRQANGFPLPPFFSRNHNELRKRNMALVYRPAFSASASQASSFHSYLVSQTMEAVLGGGSQNAEKGSAFTTYSPVFEWIRIFVCFSMMDIGKKTFPDSRFIPARIQSMMFILPMIKIPHHRNRFCIGCPYSKIGSLMIQRMNYMGAKFFVQFIMLTRFKQINIKVC